MSDAAQISPRLRQDITQFFSKDPKACNNLLSQLDSQHATYHILNLHACQTTTSKILALTRNSTDLTHVWNSTFAAWISTPTSTAATATQLPVTFIKALLLGYLDADANGSLYISSPSTGVRLRVVLAPPPTNTFRYAPIWARDWRFIPFRGSKRSAEQGIFEILLRDVVNLHSANPSDNSGVPADFQNPYHTISLTSSAPFCIRGVIRAKSCIIAARSTTPCFFIELTASSSDSDTCIAFIVVFRGKEAMKWWPFLNLGHDVGLQRVTVSVLPSYQNRRVLKACPPLLQNVHSFSAQDVPAQQLSFRDTAYDHGDGHQNTRKRLRTDPQISVLHAASEMMHDAEHQKQYLRLCHSRRLVTYEGEISKTLADGRYELDGRVSLHLGGFNASCAGPAVTSTCLRVGTRIEVSWVHVVDRTSQRITLFPTGRTVLNILYFGELNSVDCIAPRREWQQTPWRWLWKRWRNSDILWAERLYESLMTKFENWLSESSQSVERQAENNLMDYLLGTRDSTGLVQYVMHLQSQRADLLQCNTHPARNLYDEFFSPLGMMQGQNLKNPITPTMLQVSQTLGFMWRKHVREWRAKYSRTTGSLAFQRTPVVFSCTDIVNVLVSGQNKSKKPCAGGSNERIALVGLLSGPKTGHGRATLSDATDSLFIECQDALQPFMLGAIVCIESFSAVVLSCNTSNTIETIILLKAESIKVVVDGPCIATESQKVGETADQDIQLTQAICTPRHPSQKVFGHRLTQQVLTQSTTDPSNHREQVGVIDTALVCMFVEIIGRAQDHVTLTGRLLAVSMGQSKHIWHAVDQERNGFWKCSLEMTGEAAVQTSLVFREHNIYSISCTELDGQQDPAHYVKQKALSSFSANTPFHLFCELESKFPWIENLGDGAYMRFDVNENNAHCFKSQISCEGEQYMYVMEAVEQFKRETRSKVISELWNAYSWTNADSLQNNETLTVAGVVVQFSHEVENNVFTQTEQASVARLLIRDEPFGIFGLMIKLYNCEGVPHALLPGMKVIVHNVIRVPLQGAGRFAFIANCATSVSFTGNGFCEHGELNACCRRLRGSISSLVERVKRKHLWDLSCESETKNMESCAVGLVQFDVLRIMSIRLNLVPRCGTCESCVVKDGKSDWTLEASGKFLVDDGSTEGLLVCEGLETIIELVGSREDLRSCLKRVALMYRSVELDDEFLKQSRDALSHERQDALDILSHVFSNCCRAVHGVIVNRTRLAVMNGSGGGPETMVKGFQLGFGRKLWTAVAEYANRVELECVWVVEDSWNDLYGRLAEFENK